MITLNNNTVEITKSRELTPKQLLRMKGLSKEDRSKYLMSILGLSKSSIYFPKQGYGDLLNDRAGKFRRLFNSIQENSATKEHKPISRRPDSFWVGVEIECVFKGEDECEYCNGTGEEACHNCEGSGQVTLEDDNGNDYTVNCRECDGSGTRECSECDGSSGSNIKERIRDVLSDQKITLCSVRDDGSLGGDGLTGVEVTVLFDASLGYSKIQRVCKILNSLGAQVNTDCGLHVHIDQFGKTQTQSMKLGRKFGQFLPILTQLVPKSRRQNRYCHPSVSAIDGERYHAVNMTSLQKHKTIEIRLHSGSTDPNKISKWVELLRAIVNGPQVTGPISTFQGLIDSLKLNSEMTEYFDRRFAKFNPDVTFSSDEPITDDEIQGEAV